MDEKAKRITEILEELPPRINSVRDVPHDVRNANTVQDAVWRLRERQDAADKCDLPDVFGEMHARKIAEARGWLAGWIYNARANRHLNIWIEEVNQ